MLQKNPRVRKIRVRNSGVGNGCANFMDAWKKCVLSAGKPMSIKFRVLGGGFGGGGGGKCRFYFYGRADFSECFRFQDFGQGEKQTCREPWVDTALHLVPTFCAGCFLKSTVTACSSFSDSREN